MREMYFMCAVCARAGGGRGARLAPRCASMGPSARARRDPSGGNPEGGFARAPARRARVSGADAVARACVYMCARMNV